MLLNNNNNNNNNLIKFLICLRAYLAQAKEINKTKRGNLYHLDNNTNSISDITPSIMR
jgi:hypothetical protein